MVAKTPVEMLAAVDLFTVLTKKEVKKIHDAGKDVQFRAGRTIVSEGETGVGFHLIMQGKAKVTVNGRLRATLGPGDYFGEMAIIDRGPRSATVTAETDVQTLGIASWDFMPVLSENFEMCRKIMVELSRRLRDADHVLPPFFRDVAQRRHPRFAVIPRRRDPDVDPFRVHRRTRERHVVLPADQPTDATERRVDDGQRRSVAVAPDKPLPAGRHQLPMFPSSLPSGPKVQ